MCVKGSFIRSLIKQQLVVLAGIKLEAQPQETESSKLMMHGGRGPHQPTRATDVDNIILWHGKKKKLFYLK